MLLYSLLHLTGYGVTLEDLESFRQYGSKTPGHPNTASRRASKRRPGPLGQGSRTPSAWRSPSAGLAAEFNRPATDVVDHWTYTLCSDGDLQEGIGSEAASLAGHLRLSKLVALYDDNGIQLDGPTEMAWSEDVPKRFEAYGWHAQRVEDGNDVEAIAEAITAAREDDRPSLIAVRTHIGYGSPNRQDTQKAHGQPLGADEVRLVKENYGWDPDKSFYVRTTRSACSARPCRPARRSSRRGTRRWTPTPADHPDLAAELRRRLASPEQLATGWDAGLKTYADGEEIATRNASQDAIQALAGRSRSSSAARRTCPSRT
jgi:transketolase